MAKSALQLRRSPQQQRSQATFNIIIEATARLLAERGLAGLTTNAIAQKAGVSIGSLYQYFPNRDSLMVELIRREQRGHVERVRVALSVARSRSLPDLVRLLVRAAMAHHHQNTLLASAVDHEEARLPVQDIIDAALAEGGALLLDLFKMYRTEIGDIDGARAMRTLPVLVRSVVDAWSNLPDPQLDVGEEEAVRAVLGYLRAEATA